MHRLLVPPSHLTSPTFAVKAFLSLPFLRRRRVQCGRTERMEVGLSAIKTSLLFPPALPPFGQSGGGGSGLKGRVPRQRLPQQWRQGRHVTFLIGAGDIPPPACPGDAQQHTRSTLRSEQVGSAQSCLSGHSGGSLIRVLASQE